jgi:DNA-binding response OmpR family regulator
MQVVAETRGPPTILLVDDSSEVLERTRAYLQHQGYRVLSTTDPFGASALMRDEQIQLVVLDIRMPLGGDTVAGLLERFHSTPLVFYSSVDEADGEALTRKRQNASFVSKGLGLRVLAREISRRLIVRVEPDRQREPG